MQKVINNTKFLFLIVSMFGLLNIETFSADPKTILLDHYSVSEGLSNSIINSLHQDGYGYIWIATDDGLNRFDGLNFKVYRNGLYDTTSLNSSNVNAIFADSKNRLWIGSADGLNLYNPNCDCFTSFMKKEKVYSIAEDKYGNIYTGSEGGIRIFKNGEHQLISVTTGDGLPSNSIRKIEKDRKNNIIVLTEKYFLNYDHTNSSIKILFEAESTESIIGFSEDIQGFLWLCTTKQLIKLNTDNGYTVLHSVTLNKKLEYKKGTTPFLIDSENNFWIGSGNSFYNYFPAENKFQKLKIQCKNEIFEKPKVESLYEDKDGNIWISLHAKGFFLHKKNKNNFTHVQKIQYKTPTLSNNIVEAFTEENPNKIWVATFGGGLNIYNPETNEIQPYTFKDVSLNDELIEGICFDPPSTLWAATTSNGLLKLNVKSHEVIHYHTGNPKFKLPTNNLITVFKDSYNNILLGSELGVYLFDRDSKQFSNIDAIFKDKESNFPLSYVKIFEEDKLKNLWAGTYDFGLFYIDLKNKVLKRFQHEVDSNKNQLNNNKIFSLYEDERGLLWIGTMGGGVNIYNPSNNMFYHLTERNGFPGNVINGILGERNNIWFSTNNGLVRFSVPQFLYSDTLTNNFVDTYQFKKHLYLFDKADGLETTEFRYGSYFKSSDGRFYFGGAEGFDIFNPKEIEPFSETSEVLITDFYLKGNRQLPFQGDSPLDSVVALKKKIFLKHEQNYFSFQFKSINYNNPGKNQYRYRLTNFNDNWTTVSKNLTASYMNISPGEYVFEVMTSNIEGVWEGDAKKIKIIIIPPVWGRLWFQIMFVFTLIGMLYGFYRYRLFKVKLNNKALEKKVNKRTQQLKESNLQLEVQKNEILEISEKLHHTDQLKLKFFTNISHDLRTPLTLIIGPLENLLSKNDISDYIRSQLSFVYKNALSLLKLINELLDFRKLDTENLKLKARETDIIKFLKSICSLFEAHAKQKNINLKIYPGIDSSILWVDPDLIEKVFLNLLSNAFKYVKNGGNINIRLNKNELNPDTIHIYFEDDGIGIPKEQIEQIFNRFYQIEKKNENNLHYGSGIGLALCKEYIELHEGTITAYQREGGGTLFKIELKTGNKHLKPEQLIDGKQTDIAHGFNPAYAWENKNDETQIDDTGGDKSKPSVLAIDDNIQILSYIIDILKDEYRIFVASNVEEGMKKAVENLPDIILLDVMMPKASGLNLGKRLKEDERTNHIPIIIISAKTSEDEKLEGFEAGADDYVIKPFSGKTLKSRIKMRIENRRKLLKKYNEYAGIDFKNIKANTGDKEFLNKLIGILDKNLSNEDFNTAELSLKMNLSRTQLYRKMSSITDQSAGEFIRAYKMRKAAELLLEGKYNVSEVAYKLGFKTLPHFTRSFANVFNETPSKFLSKKRNAR